MPVHLNARLHCTTTFREAKKLQSLVVSDVVLGKDSIGLLRAGHIDSSAFFIAYLPYHSESQSQI